MFQLRRIQDVQRLNFSNPKDIVIIKLHTNSTKQTVLLAVANHFKGSFLRSYDYTSSVDFYKFNPETRAFVPLLSLKPIIAPKELEYFTITSANGKQKHFLSIGCYALPQPFVTEIVTYEIVSVENRVELKKAQPTFDASVQALQSFVIQNETFLAIGILYPRSFSSTRVCDAPGRIDILQFNSTSNDFNMCSSLEICSLSDIEVFEYEGKTFMFATRYSDGKGHMTTNSTVYEIDKKTLAIQFYQNIETYGATDAEYFSFHRGPHLIIANSGARLQNEKRYDVPSVVYALKGSKFEFKQDIPTSYATKWKSIEIPKCENEVLLIYCDRRSNSDQVGFYHYSFVSNTFVNIPVSLYTDAKSSFFPVPNTAIPFFIDNDLYLAVGSEHTNEGHSIYYIQYDIIFSDNAFNRFLFRVNTELAAIVNDVQAMEKSLSQLENQIENLVTTDTVQDITEMKKFECNVAAKSLFINHLDVSNGSILIELNKKHFRANPNNYELTKVKDLEINSTRLSSQIGNAKNILSQSIWIDRPQRLTNSFCFNDISMSGIANAENIHVDHLNDINMTGVYQDVILRNTSSIIHGDKRFTDSFIAAQTVNVNGKVNHLNFPTDVVTLSDEQVIHSKKIFLSFLELRTINVTGEFNRINLLSEALPLHQKSLLQSSKHFTNKSLELNNVTTLQLIDDVNVTSVASDVMMLSPYQFITGEKLFVGSIESKHDITLAGLVNGFDLKNEITSLLNLSSAQLIIGKKSFSSNFTAGGNLTVAGLVNSISYPVHLVLINRHQNITGGKIFPSATSVLGNTTVIGTCDHIKIADLVSLSSDQKIIGQKTFADLTSMEHFNIALTKTVDGVDVSELKKTALLQGISQNITGSFVMNNVKMENIFIIGNVNGFTLPFYFDLLNDSVLINGNQTIMGDKMLTNHINVAENAIVLRLNGYIAPQEFVTTHGNQNISAEIQIKLDTSFLDDITINGSVHDLTISTFSNNIVTTDDVQQINGKKVFVEGVKVPGNITVDGKVNNVSLREEIMSRDTKQNTLAGKWLTNVHAYSKTIVRNSSVIVQSTVDGVDLSEFAADVVSMNGNQLISGNIIFENVQVNGSVLLHKFVNDWNLSEIVNDVVTLSGKQIIPSPKIFSEVSILDNLIFSVIDNVSVKSLVESSVMTDQNTTILGETMFSSVTVSDIQVKGMIHGQNILGLVSEIISRYKNYTITGKKHFAGNVEVVENINATSVNDMNLLKDIVIKSERQSIGGMKTFVGKLVAEQLGVQGYIDGVNISLLKIRAVNRGSVQAIRGNKTFLGCVYAANDVSVYGNVDRVDLSDFEKQIFKINRLVKMCNNNKYILEHCGSQQCCRTDQESLFNWF